MFVSPIAVSAMALLLEHTGVCREVKPANGKYFTLAEYYRLIGCDLVEFIKLSDGRTMVIDEEGKLKPGWEINIEATELYMQNRMSYYEYREYLKSVTEKQGIALVDAPNDLVDCIAGNVLIGSAEEMQ